MKRTLTVCALLALLAVVIWQWQKIQSLEHAVASLQAVPPITPVRPSDAEQNVPVIEVDEGTQKTVTRIPDPGVSTSTTGLEISLEAWFDRIDRVKKWVNEKPELKTAELSLATNEDWLFATYHNKTESEEDFQQAYNFVLHGVDTRINSVVVEAMHDYRVANGTSPMEVSQLLPYLPAPIADIVRQRNPSFTARGIVFPKRPDKVAH